MATGLLPPRGSPTGPYPGPANPNFTTLFWEGLYKAPAENLKIKLSKTFFNALKKVFYWSYQKCERCELGLQRNTYPSSSHFYSILCGESSVLSYESVYHFMQPTLLSQGRQPKVPDLQKVSSRAASAGPALPAALGERERVLCTKQPEVWGCRFAMVCKEGKQSFPDKQPSVFLQNQVMTDRITGGREGERKDRKIKLKTC